jgi:hypothetical protein
VLGTGLHDAGYCAFAHFFRELVNLVVTIDLDGLTGRVDEDLAVIALAQVRLDLFEEAGFDSAVKIVGHLG